MVLDTRWPTTVEKPISKAPTPDEMTTAWRRGVERFPTSRNEILDARDLETGDLYMASPDAVFRNNEILADPYAIRLAQRWMLPLHMEQQIADTMFDYLREPLTGSDPSNMQAQKVEAWLRGVRSQKYPWADIVGKLVRAAQCAAFMLPSSAAWERHLSYMDTQGEDVRREWWRDHENAPTFDRAKRDTGKTAKAYREALNRWYAGRVPFSYRLVSATDCVPFFTRGDGKRRWELSSLLVRSLHDRERLLSQYTWDGHESMSLPTGWNAGDLRGSNGQFYLYEWLYYDERPNGDRIPMLAYYVAGAQTWAKDERFRAAGDDRDKVDAVVNLRERYGMWRHLMGYYWGWKRAGEDTPDRIGIPIMLPLKDLILSIEDMWGATNKHAKSSAFCGYQYIPSKDTPPGTHVQGLSPGGQDDPPPLPGSGEAIAVDGRYEPIAPAPLGPEVRYLIELGLAQLQINTPDPQLHGGSGDSSGHKLSLMHALEQSANSHLREGARESGEDFGEWCLELACTLIEHFKLEDGIPVVANLPPQLDAAAKRTPREMLTLTENMVGYRYEVTAYYPDIGSIPDVQQTSDLYDKKQASWDDLMEARGKTDPMGELVKITAHWLLVGTEQGQQDLRVWVARYRGDEEMARQLIEQGKMTEDGSTTAEITPEAMQAAQGAVGSMPSFGGAAIGGIMSGALEAGPNQADGVARSMIAGAPAALAAPVANGSAPL